MVVIYPEVCLFWLLVDGQRLSKRTAVEQPVGGVVVEGDVARLAEEGRILATEPVAVRDLGRETDLAKSAAPPANLCLEGANGVLEHVLRVGFVD